VSVLYIALPASLLLVLAAVVAFVWSVRSGQLDDLETPGVRLLLDDEPGPGDPVENPGGDEGPQPG